jgi:thiosulfate dehydrogenase [quinone] large subunit
VTSIDPNPSLTELGQTETRFDREIGYSILRFTLGINILLHGLTPLTNLDSFVAGLLQSFAKTPLPPQGVRLFALMVPLAQTVVGLLLTLGLLTRFALISGGLVMTALVFGTALRGDGPGLGIQMLYAVIYYLLLTGRGYDRFSIDHLRGNSRHNAAIRNLDRPIDC